MPSYGYEFQDAYGPLNGGGRNFTAPRRDPMTGPAESDVDQRGRGLRPRDLGGFDRNDTRPGEVPRRGARPAIGHGERDSMGNRLHLRERDDVRNDARGDMRAGGSCERCGHIPGSSVRDRDPDDGELTDRGDDDSRRRGGSFHEAYEDAPPRDGRRDDLPPSNFRSEAGPDRYGYAAVRRREAPRRDERYDEDRRRDDRFLR